MTTHSTILAWRIPCIEISDGLQSMGSQRVRQKHLSWDPNFPLYYSVSFSFLVVVYLLSHVQLFAAPWTAAHQASLSSTVSWSLLKLMSIESVMPSNHLTLCHPFSCCLQYFSGSGSFPMSWLFTSGGQSIEASASASVDTNS